MDLDDASTIRDDETERQDSDDEFLLAKEETAYQVYKTLWKDFYAWEQVICCQTLQGLEKPVVYPEELPSSEHPFDADAFNSCNEFTEWFTFESYDEPYEDTLPLKVHLEEEIFPPYSSYNICTPSSTNVQQPKGSMDKALFTPFSDDPRFKKNAYLSSFFSFAWQTEFWDPDREIIFLETARRLHYGHGFSESEIDDLRIHYVRLRVHGSAGMLWEVAQRDRLLWPAAQMSTLPDLVQRGALLNLDLYDSVTQGVVSFCDNLNCLRSACLTHEQSHPVLAVKPAMTSKDFISLQITPCNRDCFHSYLPITELDLSNHNGSWHEEDLALFSSVIKLAPDSRPCDLAVMCRKPCIETYIQRCKHFSDDDIDTKNEETLPDDTIFQEDSLALETVLDGRVKPCYHPGACNQYSNCSCYNNYQRCQRSCRCPKTCNLKFKGCGCTGPRPCTEHTDCPCRIAGRECEPEVCVTCDARNSKGTPGTRAVTCRNTVLQRGGFPQIWIREAKFGLGAFAMSKLDSGRCIGEYIGEYFGEEADALSMIRRFLRRNYAFTLTKTIYLDSYMLGNPTRYLNHSENSNCVAKMKLVNGDVKIGIYTVQIVKKTGELFLDYGRAYWSDGVESDGDAD